MLIEDILKEVENFIWKYINELPNQLLNYVLTKITQQLTVTYVTVLI